VQRDIIAAVARFSLRSAASLTLARNFQLQGRKGFQKLFISLLTATPKA
jgi:hypothetical protein